MYMSVLIVLIDFRLLNGPALIFRSAIPIVYLRTN